MEPESSLSFHLEPPIFKDNIQIAGFTSFKVGGICQYIFQPRSLLELRMGIQHIANIYPELPKIVLGEGSNVLFGSGFFPGIIIRMTELNQIHLQGNQVITEAGINNTVLATFFKIHGLTGGEFLFGLPGTIGGSAYMNARCYGQEIADITTQIETMDFEGNTFYYTKADVAFGNKYTIIQDKQELITKIYFELQPGNSTEINKKMLANKADRENKHQFDFPSAGCIFKNPYEVGIPAGKLIEDAGWKQKHIGGAEVFQHHANFIINKNQAKPEDILQLAKTIQSDILAKRGIKLEFEVRMLGTFLL